VAEAATVAAAPVVQPVVFSHTMARMTRVAVAMVTQVAVVRVAVVVAAVVTRRTNAGKS